MTIRTITQLPSVEGVIDDNSFMELSEPKQITGSSDVGYVSKKVSYKKIKDQINDQIGRELDRKYLMSEDNNPIQILNLKQRVDSLYDGNPTLMSANFQNSPTIQSTGNNLGDSNVPTVGYIANSLIPKLTSFNIGSDSKYDTAKTSTGFYGGDPEMFFTIDSGTKESKEPQTVRHTGNAVIYGWLADNGNTTSTNAWVGLFGEINDRYILLQLQPWIIGSKSSVLQYVGFNVPVKQGLNLKIMTGFPVNGSNSVQPGDIGWGINIVNAFAGYVIY